MEHVAVFKMLTIIGTIVGIGVPLLYLTAIIIAHVVRLRRVPPLPRAYVRRNISE